MSEANANDASNDAPGEGQAPRPAPPRDTDAPAPPPASPPKAPRHTYATVGASLPPGAPADIPRLDSRDRWALLLTLLLIAVTWSNAVSNMFIRWFPAWMSRGDLTFMERFTEGDSYYSHGPLVPLVSLIITFLIYRRVGVPSSRTVPTRFFATLLLIVSLLFVYMGLTKIGEAMGRLWVLVPAFTGVTGALALFVRGGTLSASVVGSLILAGALLLHLISAYARVTFVSGFALMGALTGLVTLWGGWPLLRAYWLPIAFLFFMVPLPMEMIAKLNFQLKFFAGGQAIWLTNYAFGVPALMDGSYVNFLPNADGSPKTLVVENVCSGLRSLISLICFASLFALICRVKGPWRLFMLAMAIPVAIYTNVIRITFLNLIAHHIDVPSAAPGSVFHDMSGLLVFALALGLLFGLEQLILLMGRVFKKDWSDERLLGYLDGLPKFKQRPVMMRPLANIALIFVAGVTLYWASATPGDHIADTARGAVPTVMTLDAVAYDSEELELDENTLTILETRDYIYRRFTTDTAGPFVDLLIVFTANNRKGTHPPEVCLEGGGDQIVAKANLPVPMDGRTLSMREIVTQRGQRQVYHLYIYKCGNAYTTDFFTQQATIFLNGLTGRNTSGALIRFTVPVDRRGMEDARRLALSAAASMMPVINQNLP